MFKVVLIILAVFATLVVLYFWLMFRSFEHFQEMKMMVQKLDNEITLICNDDSSCKYSFELPKQNLEDLMKYDGNFVKVKLVVSGHPWFSISGVTLTHINGHLVRFASIPKTDCSCKLTLLCPNTL